MAQFTVMQPETFKLSVVDNYPCEAGQTGKIFFNNTQNNIVYCEGLNITQQAGEYWDEVGLNKINYMGKIGIGLNLPNYELDVSGFINTTNLVSTQLGIGTTTPTEKVELLNRSIAFSSTADLTTYRITYQDAADRLDFIEGGISRILIANGGNVSFGSTPSSSKLYISGDVNYDGNLSIEGKGILYNNTAQQLRLITNTFSTGNISILNNACITWGFSFPSNSFTSAPAVAIGNLVSGTYTGEVVISVENATSSGATARFCNHSGGGLNLSNFTFAYFAIGQ